MTFDFKTALLLTRSIGSLHSVHQIPIFCMTFRWRVTMTMSHTDTTGYERVDILIVIFDLLATLCVAG